MADTEKPLSKKQIAAMMAHAIHRKEFKALNPGASKEAESEAWKAIKSAKAAEMRPAVAILRKRGLLVTTEN